MRCFQHLDRNSSGDLELPELCVIVERLTPMATNEQAQSWLEWMDSDGDGKVQMDEFIEAMGRYMEFLDDENFNAGVDDILNDRALRMGFDEAEEAGYVHPAENREYLAEIVPVLDEALNALCLRAQEDRVQLAAGKDWVDGFMPDDWKPFDSLEWLGNWLVEDDRRHKAGEPEEPEEEIPKPFSEMTRTEKIELCLNSISELESTRIELPLKTILCHTVLITTPSSLATARRNFKWLGSPGDSLVPIKDAAKALEQVATALEFSDEIFESKIFKMLNKNSLHVLSPSEKYMMAFHHIDFDNSGELDLDELVKFGRMLNPYANMEKVRASMVLMDTDKSGTISIKEFVTAMQKLVDKSKHEDTGIQRLLSAARLAREKEWGPAKDISAKYAKMLLSSPLFTRVPQVSVESVRAAQDENKKVVLIDARPEVMTSVSMIPGAVSVPVNLVEVEGQRQLHVDAKARDALSSDDLEAADLVVCYASDQPRSCVLAEALKAKFPERPQDSIANLCGGIIEWYNKVGVVVDKVGNEVQSVHCGSKGNEKFLERQSTFSLS